MVVGRRSFPIGKVTFQGRAVKLREGINGIYFGYNRLTNLSVVTSWGIMVMNAVGDEILASHILDKTAWPYQKSTTWYFGNSVLKQWSQNCTESQAKPRFLYGDVNNQVIQSDPFIPDRWRSHNL